MEAARAVQTQASAQGRRRTFAAEFPLEWLAILPVAAVDLVWAARIGFHLTLSTLEVLTAAGVFSAGLFFRTAWREQRGSLIAEYITLTFVSGATFGVLSYLAWTLAMPLADTQLLAFDRAIHFDWLHWFQIVKQHAWLRRPLRLLYDSLYYQAIYFVALFGFLRDRARLREVYWIVFVTTAITNVMCAALPALGTFEMFRLGDLGGYVADMKHLRGGSDLHFSLAHLTGVVSFPSFHTSMALIYIYAFRKMGAVSLAIGAVNLLMLPSIPFVGGHYLADMLAGGVVAGLSIIVVRQFCKTDLFARS